MKRLILLLSTVLLFFILNCTQKKSTKNIAIKNRKDITRLNEEVIEKTITFQNNQRNFQIEIYGTYEGLLSDNIVDVAKDKHNLWLCSDDGVMRFDDKTGKFLNFPFTNNEFIPNFNSFVIEDNDIMIGARSGIYKFDAEKNIYYIVKSNVSIIPRIVKYKDGFLCSDINGEIYYVVNDTVKKLMSVKEINFESIKIIDDSLYLLSKTNIYNLDLDNKKIVKLVSSKDVIEDFYKIDDRIYIGGKNLTEFNLTKTNKVVLIKFTNNKYITTLSYSEDNKIFFIGTSNGLGYYSFEKKEYKDLLTQYNKIKNAYINCIRRDESTLFIGTKNYGLIKYNLYPTRFL